MSDASKFRDDLMAAAEKAAAYREGIREREVLPRCAPGEIRAALPQKPPAHSESWESIFEDFDRHLLPGMTHWNHPRFFAYFPANNSEPSIIAELLTATIGAQCMSWQTSPAATELEELVMDWLRELIGLPEGFHGVIQDTASSATLVAVLMARERATGFLFKEEGAAAPGADSLRIYASQEAHSSIEKAVFLSGIGRRNLVRIPTDEHFALRPDALRAAIAADREAGLRPAAVIATIGSTSSTAVDPLPKIAALCEEEELFLHVDAAYAGTVAMLPEFSWLLEGAGGADSLVFNPHKWMDTNFDCSAHFVRSRRELLGTCAIDPEYLKTAHDEEVSNFRDWGIPLGRRFRALKLWFVIRRYGVEGLRARLRRALDLGRWLAEEIEESANWELAAPAPLALVCFRHHDARRTMEDEDAFNRRLLEAVNASGEAYLTHTVLGGRFTLRAHTAQSLTQKEDVEALWTLLQTAAETLGGNPR